MQPAQLTAANFSRYPPQAREAAVAQLPLLRRLPLAFVPGLLRELVEYDQKFPAERLSLDRQFQWLASLAPQVFAECFSAFGAIQMSAEQAARNWAGDPLGYSEQMSAYLWRTHQMDAFRAAAVAYGQRFAAAVPPPSPPLPRLGIAVIGQGVSSPAPELFRKLRPQGTLFTAVDPRGGLDSLLRFLSARAAAHPVPYGHWYVEGGVAEAHPVGVVAVSYGSLKPAREVLFAYIQKQVSKPGMGPEELRDRMAALDPAALGLRGDPLVDWFQLKVLTEGSGTQIFATTFTQWATREALRRAEPLTTLVRFAPRQRQRPMNELLAGDETVPRLDPEGSLVDADMATYYHWLNQGRLPGAAQAGFLAWHEGRQTALVVAPGMPRGTQSKGSIGMDGLVRLLTT